uniref:Uncharacterized protein n=1 Tax=Rhizophagus irregularis (strain DAOM 181602 / DAOM 197198 / MUCL 43194) TaxID=747089 RepID=U9TS58_RHIID
MGKMGKTSKIGKISKIGKNKVSIDVILAQCCAMYDFIGFTIKIEKKKSNVYYEFVYRAMLRIHL